jgi:hypothetical protein
MSSTSGITSGTVNTFHIAMRSQSGDYMYRSGVLKWVVEQGMWGLMRVSRSAGPLGRSADTEVDVEVDADPTTGADDSPPDAPV